MNIHDLSLLDVSERIRRRELSSAEVTLALLDRIARLDGQLHSCLLVMADSALAQARAADAEIAAGNWRGPLHGVPIGIKDLLWTKGLPTTCGMELNRDFCPLEDATVVERLRQAGAVLIAKLHMTEGAGIDHHAAFPRPVNPWSAEHFTGTSSSGSGVATAAGFCFGAIGSDTGGSIRLPSAANNVTGIKPTWGRVSRHGVMPMAETFDHVGPMARSAGDAAVILQAIAGADSRDPTALLDPVPDYLARMADDVSGLTLGIDRAYACDGCATEVVDAVERALEKFERLGMRIREIAVPWDADDYSVNAMLGAETALAHAAHFPAQAERYGAIFRAVLEGANATRGPDIAAAAIARERQRGRFRRLFTDIDLLLTPAIGFTLPTWDGVYEGIADPGWVTELVRFTMPFNATGLPTISLPGGFTADGLPIGIQLAGPWLSEPALIRAGVAFQNETDFHLRRPPLDD